MNDQSEFKSTARWFGFRAIAVYLFLLAVYRVVVPASGLPEPSFTYKMIYVDLALVMLFLLGRFLLRDLAYDPERKEPFARYFKFGIFGGGVILAIRFLNDNAFWSGHVMYRLGW